MRVWRLETAGCDRLGVSRGHRSGGMDVWHTRRVARESIATFRLCSDARIVGGGHDDDIVVVVV